MAGTAVTVAPPGMTGRRLLLAKWLWALAAARTAAVAAVAAVAAAAAAAVVIPAAPVGLGNLLTTGCGCLDATCCWPGRIIPGRTPTIPLIAEGGRTGCTVPGTCLGAPTCNNKQKRTVQKVQNRSLYHREINKILELIMQLIKEEIIE